ncbi:hypothetical protein ACIRVF_08420 [Kitasatospora sp. NPDC101157]|uniref:hypothetical protein n=1 Tax=Kitasatospora sp. NPDC101157 TaxID=3364098 RepID=UPI0038139F9C
MNEATMVCEACGQVRPWTPYGRCSWECFDQPRATSEEMQAAIDAAPGALAFVMGLAPGERVDDPG